MTAPAEHILIIRHGAFGDIVQTDGVFRDLRRHHMHAHITVMTAPPYRRIMERCPHVDDVITDARAPFWHIGKLRALRSAVRTHAFTLVYDLQGSDRSNLYRTLFLRGIPWRGIRRRTVPYIGSRIPRRPGLQKFADILQACGITADFTLNPDVSWMIEDVTDVLRDAGVTKPYIALIPGCSAAHPHKRWPHYAELATKLIELGFDVVTAPGPDEIELSRSIPGITLFRPGSDPGGLKVLDWFELSGVLSRANFVVGNDTGPSHIAACINRPGLALFGPHTSVERTGIRRGQFDAIEVPDLAALSPQRVLAEVQQRLPRGSAVADHT